MNPLVTPAWLASRLHEPNLAVLDATLPPVGVTPAVDTRARYLAQHIPGAVFFDIDALSDHVTALPHMLPSAEEFGRKMSELGIGDEMTLIVYEQAAIFSAPRAWWMLRSFGAKNVFLLDGGLRAWTEAGLPTESGEVHRAPVTFSAKLDPRAVKSFDEVQQLIATHAQLLDARSAGRFNGTAPEPRAGIVSGHMPGATNLPFTELLEGDRLKTPNQTRAIFAAKRLHLDQPITTSCGSGVTAVVLLLALELAGAQDVTLYDGSWAEYAQRPEAVIERAARAVLLKG